MSFLAEVQEAAPLPLFTGLPLRVVFSETQRLRGYEEPQLKKGTKAVRHVRKIAAWVAFLASERASYATGQSFVVDGGVMPMAAQLSS